MHGRKKRERGGGVLKEKFARNSLPLEYLCPEGGGGGKEVVESFRDWATVVIVISQLWTKITWGGGPHLTNSCSNCRLNPPKRRRGEMRAQKESQPEGKEK